MHIRVVLKVKGMSFRNARKYLKEIWFTKSEQDELIRLSRALEQHLKEQAAARDESQRR